MAAPRFFKPVSRILRPTSKQTEMLTYIASGVAQLAFYMFTNEITNKKSKDKPKTPTSPKLGR